MEEKILINEEGKDFFVRDAAKDFHTSYGFLKKEDLSKAPGTIIETNKGKEFLLLEPSFLDRFKRIKRRAQIIIPKDIGAIIANAGITKSTVVLDAGSGSGALAIFLSQIAKKVISYEIRENHHDLVKKNVDSLGIKNISLKKGDVYEKISERNMDVIILDLPEPWQAVENVLKALKVGGILVNYSPCINSVMNFMNKIRKEGNAHSFVHLKTIDLQEVQWKVEERSVRPVSKGIGHTAFLTFLRKIK